MPGRVFVSCGQATPEEEVFARHIRKWLKRRGFEPYVAIETQSIQDVNSHIIGNLKAADFYVFIDLRREELDGSTGEYRGSLFTNQELAIAYTLGFDNVLFLRQSHIRLEGIAKYVLSNARVFDDLDQAAKLVREEVKSRKWLPDYSRHLVPKSARLLSQVLPYCDQIGTYRQYICHVEIENRRDDLGAFSTIARLDSLEVGNYRNPSPDNAYLKWARQSSYERAIPPRKSAIFDAFAIEDTPTHDTVYLHSLSDEHPRQPIIQGQLGPITLHYEVIAREFPVLEFAVVVNLTGSMATTTATLA